MPFAENRGCNIYYEVEGSGPLLILQHGFFDNQASWKTCGYVDGLKENFTVASVDSLGHGQSDKPTEADRYRLAERAGDIVAVIDALGMERAHLAGYSMGGWLAVGVAMHYPQRLNSLVIGGWDCVDGAASAMRTAGLEEMSFDLFFGSASQMAPELTEWVTEDIAAALAPCFEQLSDLDGSQQAVLALDAPILLWDGHLDPYHDPMQAFAADHDFEFLSIPGDHIGAMMNGAAEAVPTINAFLLSPESS